jgi:hypothetical protein
LATPWNKPNHPTPTCEPSYLIQAQNKIIVSEIKMPELKAGDTFPEGVTFSYVPYIPENDALTACGIAQKYDASAG